MKRISNSAVTSILLLTALLAEAPAARPAQQRGTRTLVTASPRRAGSASFDAPSRRRSRVKSATTRTSTQDPKQQAREIISNIEDHNESIPTRQAEIEMLTTARSGGGSSQKWMGQLFVDYGAGKKLTRIKFNGSAPDILVDGSNVTVYVPWNGGHIYKTTLATIRSKYALYYVDPDDALNGDFTVTLLRNEGNLAVLQSKPDGPEPINGTRSVLTWIDRTTWLPVRFEFEQTAVKRVITLKYKSGVVGADKFQLIYPGVTSTTAP